MRSLLVLFGLGLLGALIFLAACVRGNGSGGMSVAPAPMAPPAPPPDFSADPDEEGLRIVLSDGTPGAGAAEGGARLAQTTDLSAAETEALLARLPPIAAEADDALAFAKREGSLPAPRAGEVVSLPFPPPPAKAPPEAAGAVLQIERRSPEGEVPIAGPVSVTFSQPMVALGSATDMNQTRPIKLEPEPPGQWRWVGTRTLLFEPTGRMPMATRFTATVLAGTRSVSGGALPQPVRWTFETPPPRVTGWWPERGPVDLNPTLRLTFDQAVDAEKIAAFVELKGEGAALPLRVVRGAEIEADKELTAWVKSQKPDRYVILRPTAPLPADTRLTLSLRKGAPSAEGPLPTVADQRSSFATRGPLRFRQSQCGWRDRCPPGAAWRLEFNNPLDPATLAEARVTVSPEAGELSVYARGANLYVEASQTTPSTTYTVTVPAALGDSFGQRLGEEVRTSIKVTAPEAQPPALVGPGRELLILDPFAKPTLPIYTTNLASVRLRIWSVGPEHWAPFAEEQRIWEPREYGQKVRGTLLLDEKRTLNTPRDALTETALDLAPFLPQGSGQLVVMVEPVGLSQNEHTGRVLSWVQATQIGLTALVDPETMWVWATDLRTGAPLPDVAVRLSDLPGDYTTDKAGLTRIPLVPQGADATPRLLLARKGADLAISADGGVYGGSSWYRRDRFDRPLWYIFDDRHMVKPGEEVFVKGLVRRFEDHLGGDIALTGLPSSSVAWTLRDARGNEVAKGEAPVDALGGFDLKARLPDAMNTGDATFRFALRSGTGLDRFEGTWQVPVQEFRRPEFEVAASVASPGPHLLGTHATAQVGASYYAGGALPGAEARWTVTASPTAYSPPGLPDFRFGESMPWWWGEGGRFGFSRPSVPTRTVSHSSRTDAAGQHYLDLHFAALKPATPMSVSATATVMDVNRQAWTSSANLLVHPAATYVGVKPDRAFYNKGQPIQLDVVAATVDGKPDPGRPISLTLVRTTTKRGPDGSPIEVEAERHEQTLTSAAAPERWSVEPRGPGIFTLTATVTDAEGRPNRTRLTVWVAGEAGKATRSVDQQDVVLIPDAEQYSAGQTAKILVAAPFSPATALITYQRSGISHTETRQLKEATDTLEVPIEAGMVPNLTVSVELVGQALRSNDQGEPDPGAAPRPAFASGEVTLRIPPLQRTLQVELLPQASALPPGGSTPVTLRVRDAAGAPVADARVALVAVDEAVLALSGYSLPDPVAAFYGLRPTDVSSHHSRSWIYLADPAALRQPAPGEGALYDGLEGATLGAMRGGSGGVPMPVMAAMPAPAPSESSTEMESAPPQAAPKRKAMAKERANDDGDDNSGAASGPAIVVRSDWNPTALWLPAVATNAAGEATVTLTLPDSLTRYRITAVAVAGADRFGKAEANVTARKPLMLRPSPPRFLNFGDRFELSYVVQNQTEAPIEVLFAARAHNARLGEGLALGRRFTVPAQDRVELRLPAAADAAGTARFQAALSPVGDPKSADAAEVSLPVWTPATSEATATYGQLDGPRGEVALLQPIAVPGEVWPQFGGLEISTSSTQLQALTDAVVYLSEYPYGCAEQIASRTLAVVALKDVLSAFAAQGLPDPATLQSRVDADLAELARRQNSDGGWSFWRRNEPSWPFLSLHVSHALVRAKAKGFTVPEATLRRALQHVRAIERYIPREYGEATRRMLRAYALYVQQIAGEPDAGKASTLLREAGGPATAPLELLGWTLPTLHDGKHKTEVAEILRRLTNQSTETAGRAHFVSSYGDDAYLILHSDRRLDGLLVDALIQVDPQSTLIPKVVADLLAHRTKGRWMSTQDNVWVLLAMDRYFRAYEGVTPDFVARAWLGDRFAGEHRFKGRGTERAQINVPMAWLAEQKDSPDLTLARTGEGRMYYRIGLRYAPLDLNLPPVEAGFAVERAYEAVDDPADLRKEADGTYVIRAGSRVRVRLTMVAPARRAHVALVDALPAGFEVINPELKVMGDLPADANPTGPRPSPWSSGWRRWGYFGPWYEHENLRDERVEAFASLLYGGVYTYTYVARATTPGDFIAPPAKAEEMYNPETFGRSGVARVRVQ